jgi:hypothetical protein
LDLAVVQVSAAEIAIKGAEGKHTSPIGELLAPRKKPQPPAPLTRSGADYREPMQLAFDFN